MTPQAADVPGADVHARTTGAAEARNRAYHASHVILDADPATSIVLAGPRLGRALNRNLLQGDIRGEGPPAQSQPPEELQFPRRAETGSAGVVASSRHPN